MRGAGTSNAFGARAAWGTQALVAPQPRPPGSTVADYLTVARSLGYDHLEINARINADYVVFATKIQQLVDREFAVGHPTRLSPNWFAIGFHVSLAVGRMLAGVKVGLGMLHDPVKWREASPRDILVELGLPPRIAWMHPVFSTALRIAHVPPQIGSILFGALRLHYGALWNPATLIASVVRLSRLLEAAHGSIEDRARSVLEVAFAVLGEGNQAIYADIAGGVETYLSWRAARPITTAQNVVDEFTIGTSEPSYSRNLYELALARPDIASTSHVSADENTLLHRGHDLLVASFALYERARVELDRERATTLVETANALLALREQRDLLQPDFDVDRPELTGGGDGRQLFRAITPLLQVHFGSLTWNYSAFRFAILGNWANFADRWPAIMAAFETLYASPRSAWEFPNVYVTEETTVAANAPR